MNYSRRKNTLQKGKPRINKELFQFGLIAIRQLRSNAIVVVRKLDSGDMQLFRNGMRTAE